MADQYISKSNKILSPKTQNKIDKLCEKLEIIYPKKIVVYLKRDYDYLSSRIRDIRYEAGYMDNAELLADFGFQYVDVNLLDTYANKSEIQEVIDEINSKRKESIENINSKFDVSGFDLPPLEEFYYDNEWHSKDKVKPIDIETQTKINKIMNRLLELYPKRVVYRLYTTYRKFSEDSISPLKNQLGYNSYKEFVEAYGFVFLEERKSVIDKNNTRILIDNQEVEPLEKFYRKGKWINIVHGEKYGPLNQATQFVFDVLYALYPNRKVNSLDIASQIENFDISLRYVMKEFHYKNIGKFLKDYGFLYNKYFNVDNICLPDAVYSLDKKVLHKVFTKKSKFAVLETVEVIATGCFKNLNLKVIDLSLIADHSLTLEEQAITDCKELEYILNPTAIKKSYKGSVNMCPKLRYDLIHEELMAQYFNRTLCYEIKLTNALDESLTILTDKLYPLGTYLMNIKNKMVYLIERIYCSKLKKYLNLDSVLNYIECKDESFEPRIIFNYDDLLINGDVKSINSQNITRLYIKYRGNQEAVNNFNFDNNIKLYSINEWCVPVFEKNKFVKYNKVSTDYYNLQEYKNIVDSVIHDQTKSLVSALCGINQHAPYLHYINFIYDEMYIKTFLKFHHSDSLIFTNSETLMKDSKFITTLFQLYPYTDTNIILSGHLKNEMFIEEILNIVQGDQNKNQLLERLNGMRKC